MNKRDIIIISVLINAALLSVLFFTATGEEQAPIPIAKEEHFPTPPSIVVPNNIENEPVAAPKKEESVAYSLPPVIESKEEKKETRPTPKPSVPIQLPQQKMHTKEIKVQSGDSLDKIAKRYHSSVKELMAINHLSSTFLHAGQLLKVPAHQKQSPKVDKPNFYTVKAGDNPWTIAMKHHIKVEELLRLNHLDEKKARKLKPGDQLRIR
jgi:peptidoglycan DL-endopeptidase LytF